ncbi:MAG: TRAP-type C4-dicarboxylate transport system, small permease component [Rhodobacteraceae bacterium HLUCCA12]|nr:MAG: TRAP-type C4-dicarboxylate transport system, small permease component [Rhodobacteraceae bacterium HLUCCA12]
MPFFRRAERAFVALNAWVVIACLVAMTGVVFSNVGLRYLTGQSIAWADEVARYLMIWMTFLGAGLALRQGGHVAIANLHDILPVTARRVLRAAIVLLLLGFFGYMVWVGHEYMGRMGRQLTPATRVSYWYVYLAIPTGFVLLIVHLLLIAPRFIASGEHVEDDPGVATGGQHG